MRFAAIDRTTLSQPEVAIGILPSGSGSARRPHLVGRARALEVTLACEYFAAELAQTYGLINHAVPADEMDDSTRIASFPITAIQSVKLAGDAALDDPREALLEEAHQFNLLGGTSEAQVSCTLSAPPSTELVREWSHYLVAACSCAMTPDSFLPARNTRPRETPQNLTMEVPAYLF
jgi:hypothetical protein|tara:strand:+ start:2990 stop:3520 length:531 start_codon:yes stop_codon:yes gene_type:complete